MAVIGYLDEVIRNHGFPELVRQGLDYLATLTAATYAGLAPGEAWREELAGTHLFAIHQVYQTRGLEQAQFEAHRRYIDIQFIYEGRELIRVAALRDAETVCAYEASKDCAEYRIADASTLAMRPGMVCVLNPEDVHAPCLDYGGKGLVKKTVVKVLAVP